MFKTSATTSQKYFAILALSALTLVNSGSAHAQLDQQTGIADPGRVERALTADIIKPQVGPSVSVREAALIEAPEGAEDINFKFGGVRIDGANIYTKQELLPLYENLIGTEISLADLYAIANRITLKYRNDGYVLTQVVIPPQTIDGGVARLQIVEGFIDNIIIQGDDQSSRELETIRQYASQIGSGQATNIAEMERQLLLINDLPGVNARSIISPSTTAGAADLLIIVERDSFEAGVGINNHGSRFLGQIQTNGFAQLNSIFGTNDQITGQFVVAPDSGFELAFGSLGYKIPVGPYGTTMSVIGSITETDPGFTLRQFEVEGLSRSFTVRAEHPFVRSRNQNLFGRLQLDYRNVDSKNNIEETRKDRIRAFRAGLQAEFLDRLMGVAVNSLDLEVSQGINFFGASDKGDDNLSRAAGDPTFTKANLQLQRLQRVTNSINVLLTGRAQLSNQPLLSSEEFGLGGISSVRGFDPSEVVGDDGVSGSVELQWTPATYRNLEFFTFLDSGTVWNKDATNSADKRESLTSTGVGARVDFPMDVSAELLATQPLHRDVDTMDERDPRFYFSLNKNF
ncbi:MAG: ShlB/FhaC/HecB family hemolysin secretion/activation protein [Pseudomonadota bacterium]